MQQNPAVFGQARAGLLEQFKPAVHAAQPKEQKVSLRIVKVVIADPTESLPLDKRVLYAGQETTTDLTDQELFYDVPIKQLMDDHNKVRAETRDKKAAHKADQVIYLEPIRIRDLKMVVVNIAQF
jgi:hypothetical protein